MTWMDAAAELRSARVPAVLITLASVRGHAPREAGAKMIVTADDLYGTIGGGNLEMTAVTRAREMLTGDSGDAGERLGEPEMLTLRLNDKAPAKYGRQCCGGEVALLLEPLPVPATVAIFGAGNIGLELTRILARHEIDLHVTDSRPEHLGELDRLEPPVAELSRHFAVVGEEVRLVDELLAVGPGGHLSRRHLRFLSPHACERADPTTAARATRSPCAVTRGRDAIMGPQQRTSRRIGGQWAAPASWASAGGRSSSCSSCSS